jgi:hypothetical protein
MSIASRLGRLERGQSGDSCGPGCPPVFTQVFQQKGLQGEEVLKSEEGSREPCVRCGRPAVEESLVEIIIDSREEAQEALRLQKKWQR